MKRRAKISLLLLPLLLILLTQISVSAAGLSKKSASVTAGSSFRLTLSSSSRAKVTWKSSNAAVAAVTQKGVVSGKKAGKAVITAVSGGKRYTCSVTVTRKPTAKVDGNTAGMTAKEAKAYRAMVAMKKTYYEGRTWTEQNYYAWKGGLFRGGSGCAAFAFLLSDAAFGSAPAKLHYNMGNVKVGDIVRVDHNTHFVIVLKIVGNTVVLAEGCYGTTVHWGRTMTRAALRSSGSYVLTRY